MNLGYTGKPYDTATGMYNYGYRDYRPAAARFTTVDPIRDGNNWFAYVNNDPVNYLDPWGLKPGQVFPTVDAAAANFGSIYNNDSIINNREYGASIYRKGGGYAYTVPIKGEEASVLPSVLVFNRPIAFLHTHGGFDPRYESNIFSSEDKKFSNLYGIPIYVATPNGSLLVYDPKTGIVLPVDYNMPSDRKEPYNNGLHPPENHIDNPSISGFFKIINVIKYLFIPKKGK
jgi:RHS repeat-associated protein